MGTLTFTDVYLATMQALLLVKITIIYHHAYVIACVYYLCMFMYAYVYLAVYST